MGNLCQGAAESTLPKGTSRDKQESLEALIREAAWVPAGASEMSQERVNARAL